MDGMVTFGRTSLLCTLLLWLSQVCWASVVVTVTPKVEVMKGESVSLPCTFTVSTPSANTIVEWFMDDSTSRKRLAYRTQGGEGKSDEGTPLAGRASMTTDFSLVITGTLPDDQHGYICQVTAGPSGVAEATSDVSVFFAPEKPEISASSSQAISVDSPSSSEVSKCVSMNGHPQPRIIWYKNSQPLPEVKDSQEKTYMVPSVVKESSGLYTVSSTLYMQPTKADKDSVFSCKVEYSMPNKEIKHQESDTIKLNLNYPSEKATFTLLNKGPIKEGDEVKMMCETDGNPQPEFEFFKDGAEIPGSVGGLLTFDSIKRNLAGLYSCKAIDFDNLDAELTDDIDLSVSWIEPLSVTPAGPLSAMLGDMVELQCKTKGSDSHTIQWTKDSKVLSQSGVLSLKGVTFDNAGQYVCVGAVPSVPGLTARASLNLTVSGKPEIDAPVDGSVEKVGDVVTLSCSAHGHPAPQFTWTPSGKESVAVEGEKVVSTVTLEASEEVMKTGVTCEASNKHGSSTKTFNVAIKAAKASDTDAGNDTNRADKQQGGSTGVIVAVVVCVLLLLLLVALLYFLNKKGKLPCGKKDKKEVAGGEGKSDIVVEMKTDKDNEDAGLLNKRPAPEQ